MSDQEIVVTKRRVNRLNLDSEEQARIQEEERQRQEQIRLKKQQKRRRRQQEAKKAQQQEKKRLEQQRHYEDPQTMLQPDSDSDDHFQRVQKKIRKAYPQYHSKKRQSSQSEGQQSQQSDQESQSEQESSNNKKKVQKKAKNQKRQRKQRRRQESQELRAPRQKVEKVKIEEKDPKEKLVGEIAIRWWYCLPQWPPADYDYEGELKKLGYRLVESNRFRMQENLVNGLFKATTVDGYVGVFKTKQKIIDIRPKQTCPSLQFLRSKSIGQLTSLLKTALKQQISQLTNQQFQGNGDLQLIEELTRQLNSLNE